MKYNSRNLRSSKKLNKETINEEISMSQVGMIMQAVTALGPQVKTITLQQAISEYGTPETKFDIVISVARTSEEEVDYTRGIKENLPTDQSSWEKTGAPTHYLKGSKQKYNLAVKQGLPVFYYFEYITEAEAKEAGAKKTTAGSTDITDFLKVGSEIINEKGSMTFDLSDGGDEEIIVSGNGLFLLVRTAANNQKELDKGKPFIKMNVVDMKSAKVDKSGKFEDSNFLKIKTNSDKQTMVKEYIYLLFTMGSKHYDDMIKKPSSTGFYLIDGFHGEGLPGIRDGKVSNFNKGYGEIVRSTQFGSERDELIKDALTGQLFMMNDWLFPLNQGIITQNLADGKFNIMSRSEMQSYLDKFNQAQTETERDQVVVDFMTEAMEDYKENFLNMVDIFAKDINITKEQILKEFDIEKGVNQTLRAIKGMLSGKSKTEYKTGQDPKVIPGAFEYVKKMSNVIGTKPTPGKPGTLPFKDIETAETVVKVGETKYQIRTKTASAEKTGMEQLKDVDIRRGTGIKKESFRYLKTYEGFRRIKK